MIIKISSELYSKVCNELNLSKKIIAIKTLLDGHRDDQGRRMSLKDAKQAIERLQWEKFNESRPSELGSKIVVVPIIKQITCDFGDGPVSVDVEKFQIKILSELQTVGLEATGHLLELCQAIKAFSEGKRIGIIDDLND